MSKIWLTDKPFKTRSELLQERIEVLEWVLAGKPARTNLQQLIIQGLSEVPLQAKRQTKDQQRFLGLAAAVTLQERLTPLDRLCFERLTGSKPLSRESMRYHPEVRRYLKPSSASMPPVWRAWLRHDWEHLKTWLRVGRNR